MLRSLVCVAALAAAANAQVANSWPQDYPGKPSGDLSTDWQSYYEVTQSLPNVSFSLPRNWAGNIAVDRAGHPNDTLFFWAWEKQNGSFTANSTEPWGIWLNGGPGSSSMLGLFFENGPLGVVNQSLVANNYSWNTVADYVWIDQPVGTGFATADETGYVADEDQMGTDFMNFLANLVKVFPNLKTRPLYLTGESYAGTYIPYIMKAYFGMQDPPVNISGIAIGGGTLGNTAVFEQLPVLSVIETYPQLIGYDTQVYEYFKEQSHLCGYDLNLTYPQDGYFPPLNPPLPKHSATNVSTLAAKAGLLKRLLAEDATLAKRDAVDGAVIAARDAWKRDLAGRANGTIDPWYQCDLYHEMVDYALNYSLPWKGRSQNSFEEHYIPDAVNPEPSQLHANVYLNDATVRAAIHAPTSKNWTVGFEYPFNSTNDGDDPSPVPMVFLTELATNATEKGVRVVLYSGNDDSLVAHLGSQVVIQNTTFGGVQGFSRPPATPWYDDAGEFAGIVHQERNWTYVLVAGAGHLVPQQQPDRALVLVREFIFGSNTTGLVTDNGGTVSVAGGEVASLAAPVLPGQSGIYVGHSATQSTMFYPTATVAAWESFIATAVPSSSFSALPSDGAQTGGAGGVARAGFAVWGAFVGVGVALVML